MLTCPDCEEPINTPERLYCPACGAELPAESDFGADSQREAERHTRENTDPNTRRRSDAPAHQSDPQPHRDGERGHRPESRSRAVRETNARSAERGSDQLDHRHQERQPQPEPPPGESRGQEPQEPAESGPTPRNGPLPESGTHPTASSSESRRSFPLGYLGVLFGAGVVIYSATQEWAEANVTVIPEPGGPTASDGIEIGDVDATPGASGLDTWAGPVIIALAVLVILVVLWDIKRRSYNQHSHILSEYDDTNQVLLVLLMLSGGMSFSFVTAVDSEADLVIGGAVTLATIMFIFGSLCAFLAGQRIRGEPDSTGVSRHSRREAVQYIGGGSLVALIGSGSAFTLLEDEGPEGGEDDALVSDFSEQVSTTGGETIDFGPQGADIPAYADLQSVTFECEDGQLTTTIEMEDSVPELVGGDEQMEFSVTFDTSKPDDDGASPLFVQYVIETDDTATTHSMIHGDEPTVSHDGSTIEFEFSLHDSLEEFVGAYYEDETEIPDTIGGQAVTHYNGTGERIQWVPAGMENKFDESTWVSLPI